MNEKTKLICVCTPNNPTGQVLSRSEIALIVAIAAKHGAWILSDEVYRGAELDSVESASFSGRGERIVVTGGLSKVYGLPGLRIGWLVAPEAEAQAALRLKDYTTIAPATLSESLAEIALERRDELIKRARFILGERWPKLEDWADDAFARAPLDAAAGRRHLLLQLPLSAGVDGPRRPAHPRVLDDGRARGSTSAPSGTCASATGWSRGSSTPGWQRSIGSSLRWATDARAAYSPRLASGESASEVVRDAHAQTRCSRPSHSICGILMVAPGDWSRFPLAAIAIICLALTYFV